MNRTTLWLGTVGGLIVGLLAGFFLGQTLSSGPSRPSAIPSSGTHPSHSDPSSPSASAFGTNSPGSTPAPGQFGHLSAPTTLPGLTSAIADALHQGGLFGQAHLISLIETMPKEGFPVLLEMLRQARPGFNGDSVNDQGPAVWSAFWNRFGEIDPPAALATALSCTDLQYARRENLEKALFKGMAGTNPTAAAQAWLDHPELPHRNRAIEGLMSSWSSQDPRSALAWALQNAGPENIGLAVYATTWGINTANDISKGNALLQNLPEGAPVGSIVHSMQDQIGRKPGVPVPQILDFLETARSLDARNEGFEYQMAVRCAQTDAFAAANFFAQPVPDGTPFDNNDLRVVMSAWIPRDPKAAEAWAKGQEGTPSYPAIAEEFARAAHDRNDAAEEQRWLRAAGQP